MSKIVIMESLGISDDFQKQLQKPFEKDGHIFAVYSRTSDHNIMIEQAKDADALILANMPLPAEVIRACSKLRFIDIAFTGIDHVGLEAAKEKGIAVSNASGYSDEAVAELVLGMTLQILRNLSAVEKRCRNGQTKEGLVGSELKGKTVGIIGLGRIGTRSAALFHAFGCCILGQSRTYKADAPTYVEQVDQTELLQRSDIVVLHCPLNASTRGMIDRDKLALMKQSAILINVARGPVVNAKDLAEALNNGVIRAAGVDVFDREPPLDAEEPLLHCKNCLVTPHVAFATEESMQLRAQIVFDNLDAWIHGRQQNVILP